MNCLAGPILRISLRMLSVLRVAPVLRAFRGCLLVLCLVCAPVGTVWAQGTTPSVEAGKQQEKAEDAGRSSADEAELERTQLPELRGSQIQDRQNETFVLLAIDVEGSTVFPFTKFIDIYESYLARDLSSGDLSALARAITQLYYDQGYLLSQAVVPPQDVDGGFLQINVVEGYIGNVVIEGAGALESDLQKFAQDLLSERPAKIKTLETLVLKIGDVPGVRIKDSRVAVIDDATGQYELWLTVETKKIDLYADLDNRGSREVGKLQMWLSGGVNSLATTGDNLKLGALIVPDKPGELNFARIDYSAPVGPWASRIEAGVSSSRVNPGASLAASNIHSESFGFYLGASQPLVRTQNHSLWLRGSFAFLNVEQDQAGLSVFRDRLRVLRVSVRYKVRDPLGGMTDAELTSSLGLDVLNASTIPADATSRFDADGSFSHLRLSIYREQPVTENFGANLFFKGQLAQDALLSSEEISLGGYRFGRGYDFSEVSGDSGVAGSIEIYYGADIPGPIVSWAQVYGFYDHGAVWNRNFPAATRRATLKSAGAGLRVTLVDNYSVSFEADKPLNRPVFATGDKDWRYFFQVGARF